MVPFSIYILAVAIKEHFGYPLGAVEKVFLNAEHQYSWAAASTNQRNDVLFSGKNCVTLIAG